MDNIEDLKENTTKHDRDLEWYTIFSGINSLFNEEIDNEEIKVSPSKGDKFVEYFEKGLKAEDVKTKKENILAMRKLFSKKSELDHFLYLAGIHKQPPMKPSNRIRREFFT